MSDLTLPEAELQFWELYQAHHYHEALTVLEQTTDLFEGGARADYYNWKMCAASLAGQIPLAISTFREALADGVSWQADYLHNDSDLAALQGNPEYEQLVSQSDAYIRELRANTKPQLWVLPPTEMAKPPYPWLLALHGNSSNPHVPAFAKQWPAAAAKGWLVALPTSSQITAPDRFVWNNRETMIGELQTHLTTIRTDHKIATERGLLAGFSMGGGQALWLALTGTIAVRGVIGIAPWLPANDFAALETAIADGKANHLQVMLTVSRRDANSLEVVEKIAALLTQYDVRHTVDISDAPGHVFPDHFETLLSDMLASV